jgi:hypothetical protein
LCAEDGSACDGCGDDGQDDGALAGFGWCVEGDGSFGWDERPDAPLFGEVFACPELFPVDDAEWVVLFLLELVGVDWCEFVDLVAGGEVVGDVFAVGWFPEVDAAAACFAELDRKSVV